MFEFSDINIFKDETLRGFVVKDGNFIAFDSIDNDDYQWIEELKKTCIKENINVGDDSLITIKYKSQDIRLRAHLESSIDGEVFILRNIPKRRPSLTDDPDISYPKELIYLVNKVFEGAESTKSGSSGLIIVSGPLGSGKTTTASSVLAHCLDNFGGQAWTVEDPAEYLLQGNYKKGICYQHNVKNNDFNGAIRRMLRCYSVGIRSILFISEIRTDKDAGEILKALQNGTWVIFTIHAGSVVETVNRLITLCNSKIAPMILSTSLKLIINQSMSLRKIDNKKSVKYEYLYFFGEKLSALKKIVSTFDEMDNPDVRIDEIKVAQSNNLLKVMGR